jgi:FSR family fosmidomycin resistance protein-like MFS transporter
MNQKFQTAKVITISFGHLLHDIYTAFLAPMLPLLISKHGMSLSMAGLLDVIRRAPSLFNPFIGLLADKVCVKYLVILTPAVSAITMSSLGLAPSYPVLFILLFVTGISSTLFHVPSPVLVKHFAGTKTATAMSYFMFGGELARTLGPLLITAALSWWGLEGSYKVMPLGLLASLILFIKLKDLQPIHDQSNLKNKIGAGETLRTLIPFFIAITGFLLFQAAMKSALTLYLPTYLTGEGYSLWVAGISLSVLQFAGAASTFATGYIADRITHRRTLLIVALTSPFVMWMFIHSSEWLMMPVLIIMGFMLFASGPVILALVQDTNTTRPAFVNGIYMTLNFMLSSLMVLVVGILGDSLGLKQTFQISAALALLSVPFVFILPGKSGEKQNGK